MPKSKYSIRLLALAEQDFSEIIEYILAENPSAALAVAEEIEHQLKLLESNPNLGRIPNEEDLQKLGYRYLVVRNYLIFYKFEGQTIWVYRILHGARDYKPLL